MQKYQFWAFGAKKGNLGQVFVVAKQAKKVKINKKALGNFFPPF